MLLGGQGFRHGTSSSKSGLGTAVSRDSRVWFTLSHGILNEIYYPRVDHACTRDLGLIVTDGQTFFSRKTGCPLGDLAGRAGDSCVFDEVPLNSSRRSDGKRPISSSA